MHRQIFYSVIFSILLGCGSGPTTDVRDALLTEINLAFDDPMVRKILEHQDRIENDSLLQYFRYRDPTYRYLAASAFASIPADKYIDTLATLLSDPIAQVRQAAAYSLGQAKSARAEAFLIRAFQNHDTLDANSALNATILEALGKCASANTLALISQVTTYRPSDQFLLLGQARAIYRFMLRNITHTDGTERMINFLADAKTAQSIRILAANYLARGNLDLQSHSDLLSLIYSNEDDSEVLLFLPQALIKSNSSGVADLLRSTLAEEMDYRVRCNTLRAMAAHDYDSFKRDIHRRLYDKNRQVARVASDCIVNYGKSNYWREYMNLSLDDFAWTVKINLLHAVNKFIPPGNGMFRDINDQKLQQRIRNTNNEYEQSAAILALAQNARWHRFVIDLLNGTESKVLRSACTKALLEMMRLPNFNRLRQDLRQNVVDQLVLALKTGDVGEVEIASGIFDIKDLELKSYGHPDPVSLLNQAIDKLELPRDIEAHIALRKNLANLNQQEYSHASEVIHTHPIDWNQLTKVSDSTRVKITTTKGSIIMQLFPITAPGTVANFVDLVNLNYFAGKTFHRVVPVFVIQGGCNRGDGYGSMDYNIRSELNQVYFDQGGYLGMASAGNHTESAQWFITHNASPHLDGKYTIFGKVVQGMDIVHDIEVGDQIEQISLN